jgi:SAM-dependent methyltransferase
MCASPRRRRATPHPQLTLDLGARDSLAPAESASRVPASSSAPSRKRAARSRGPGENAHASNGKARTPDEKSHASGEKARTPGARGRASGALAARPASAAHPAPGQAPGGPDRTAALAQYRRRARFYDLELALFEPIRRIAIGHLDLRPGDVVLDLGCGTGLSLSALRAAVGDRGRVIGIEQSPEMIERARARVRAAGWRNVTLLCAPVESARIRVRADAALFHFTHDVLRRVDAINNVLGHLRAGARVVATGLKWAPLWAVPVNLFVLNAALYSMTSLAGLDAPWGPLGARLAGLEVSSMLAGGVYVASGRFDPHPGL